MKLGNAGGGKGPQVGAMPKGTRVSGVAMPITPNNDRRTRQHHMPK